MRLGSNLRNLHHNIRRYYFIKMELKQRIKHEAERIYQEVKRWREHIHAHPELSYQEYETSAFIQQKLLEKGITFQSNVAQTGVVALIKGEKSESASCVALRGDMDALPILEENNVPYRSVKNGIMHACGHDVHTSCLLGAAYLLYELREHFSGTVKLIFQPGEEKSPGGASIMIKEGVLSNPSPERIFGQHVAPDIEVGKVGFYAGKYMASADEIYITIHGKGGHAAAPHTCIDPIVVSAHLITTLQSIISRNCPPLVPSVLTFGKIQGGNACNVIPDSVRLEGTFRSMDEEWRNKAKHLIREQTIKLCESMGASVDIEMPDGYPCLTNDIFSTQMAKDCAISYLGNEHVLELVPRMSSEDFAFFSLHIPVCFYRLGVANNAKNINSPVHTSTFDIDARALQHGVGLFAFIAVSSLGNR